MAGLEEELKNRQRRPWKEGFYRLITEEVCYVHNNGKVELSDGSYHEDMPGGLVPLEIRPEEEIEKLRRQASFIERVLIDTKK